MRARREQLALEPVAVRIPRAAAMLGIGRSTLYLCIAAGEIETVKVGRATLVPVDSLRAFIASRRGALGDLKQVGKRAISLETL